MNSPIVFVIGTRFGSINDRKVELDPLKGNVLPSKALEPGWNQIRANKS